MGVVGSQQRQDVQSPENHPVSWRAGSWLCPGERHQGPRALTQQGGVPSSHLFSSPVLSHPKLVFPTNCVFVNIVHICTSNPY